MDSTRLKQLEKQLASNRQKCKRYREKLTELENANYRLADAIHAERLREHIGKKVKRRYRRASTPEMNDALGTLLSVRRTRCSIDFGELGKWDFLLKDVALPDQEQGFELS